MLSVGGSGVISTIGNIAPKQTSQMIHHYFAGELETAKEIQLAQIPLIQVIFSEVNPVPVKKAVGLLKGIETNYRLPLGQPEDETVANLQKEMTAYGLL